MSAYDVIDKICLELERRVPNASKSYEEIEVVKLQESVIQEYFEEFIDAVICDLKNIGLKEIESFIVSAKEVSIDDGRGQGATIMYFRFHPPSTSRCLYIKALIHQRRILIKKYEGCSHWFNIDIPYDDMELNRL